MSAATITFVTGPTPGGVERMRINNQGTVFFGTSPTSFQEGDWVMQPDHPESVGSVFDVRDYGIEVWVRRLNGGEGYYTYADQLIKLSILEVLALEAR